MEMTVLNIRKFVDNNRNYTLMKHYFFVVQHNNEIYENWYFMNIDETTVTVNQLSFYATTF